MGLFGRKAKSASDAAGSAERAWDAVWDLRRERNALQKQDDWAAALPVAVRVVEASDAAFRAYGYKGEKQPWFEDVDKAGYIARKAGRPDEEVRLLTDYFEAWKHTLNGGYQKQLQSMIAAATERAEKAG